MTVVAGGDVGTAAPLIRGGGKATEASITIDSIAPSLLVLQRRDPGRGPRGRRHDSTGLRRSRRRCSAKHAHALTIFATSVYHHHRRGDAAVWRRRSAVRFAASAFVPSATALAATAATPSTAAMPATATTPRAVPQDPELRGAGLARAAGRRRRSSTAERCGSTATTRSSRRSTAARTRRRVHLARAVSAGVARAGGAGGGRPSGAAALAATEPARHLLEQRDELEVDAFVHECVAVRAAPRLATTRRSPGPPKCIGEHGGRAFCSGRGRPTRTPPARSLCAVVELDAAVMRSTRSSAGVRRGVEFLRHFSYCSLYEVGYTSLGKLRHGTQPRAAEADARTRRHELSEELLAPAATPS